MSTRPVLVAHALLFAGLVVGAGWLVWAAAQPPSADDPLADWKTFDLAFDTAIAAGILGYTAIHAAIVVRELWTGRFRVAMIFDAFLAAILATIAIGAGQAESRSEVVYIGGLAASAGVAAAITWRTGRLAGTH